METTLVKKNKIWMKKPAIYSFIKKKFRELVKIAWSGLSLKFGNILILDQLNSPKVINLNEWPII